MINYALNTNKQNEALFIMRTGKDYVYGTMPYARAVKMCDDGNVTKGDNPDYPVALDDKYFFQRPGGGGRSGRQEHRAC